MTMIKRCDGCQDEITELDDHVTVERQQPVRVMGGDRLPADGAPLHWCRDCALFAITALAERAAR
jgi:hypothetical protein